MAKTVKFSISVPAAEFKALESARRKARRTRSQFIRDSLEAGVGAERRAVMEERGRYGPPLPADVMDMAALRRRAVAAAGRFESGLPDLSVDHDRHLTDERADGRPGRGGERR